jgi:hypothetical protein
MQVRSSLFWLLKLLYKTNSMNRKEIKDENSKIEDYRKRIRKISKQIRGAKGKDLENLMRDQSILHHKIRASEERILNPCFSSPRIYTKSSDGYFKR